MSLQMHISVQVHWSTKYSSSPSKLPCHNFALCIFLCLFCICICIFNNRRCVLCLQNWPAIICHQLPYAPQKGTLRSNMSFIHKPRSIFCRIHWKLWLFEISKKNNKQKTDKGWWRHSYRFVVCLFYTNSKMLSLLHTSYVAINIDGRCPAYCLQGSTSPKRKKLHRHPER